MYENVAKISLGGEMVSAPSVMCASLFAASGGDRQGRHGVDAGGEGVKRLRRQTGGRSVRRGRLGTSTRAPL